jgi:inner membrane protein
LLNPSFKKQYTIMDNITQAALGAAIGEATLGKHIGNKGVVFGAIVVTIPYLDDQMR